MGYANPEFKISYDPGLQDVVTNAGVNTFRGPKGKSGKIRDIMISGQTLCTNVTTGPFLQIGTVATPTLYANVAIGALAAGANIAAAKDQPNAIVSGVAGTLPADTDFQIKLVAPTGGAPAGKIFSEIVIDWF